MNFRQIAIAILSASFATAAVAAGDVAQERNKIVRVVTVTQDRIADEKPPKEFIEETIERMDQAASIKPDIVCLPEMWDHGTGEAVPGPTTERMSKWAKAHNCYVISPIITLVGGRKYNSSVLLDRKGQVVGQYNKIHPTEGEIEGGITPGPLDPPVFQTDFGVIGMQICWDADWPESWTKFKEKGAKIVFWSSAYPAERQVAAFAWLNQIYIVSATDDRTSRIYDITGDELASTGRYQEWAAAELPVGKQLFEIDYNVKKARAAQQKYGNKIQVSWLHQEDWLTIASVDPNLTVEDLIAEFGLLPMNVYHARATKVQDEARSKTPDQPKPQSTKEAAPAPAPGAGH